MPLGHVAQQELEALREVWQGQWAEALAQWSRFTRLTDPRWCFTVEDEKREGLTGSFAMIRLGDQAVVIGLAQVHEKKLDAFAVEILAHEIGHHVYCPANLLDHGRMIARMRAALPTRETLAPFIANLYGDLLINDRLQRSSGLNMAGVYKALDDRAPEPSLVTRLRDGLKKTPESQNRLWTLYLRMYEILWSLQTGTLAAGSLDRRMEGDAQLGARLIRSYARDWLDGSGRFAALCLPYLLEDEGVDLDKLMRGWLDTKGAVGSSKEIPDGLAEIEAGEKEGAIHPSLDPELAGLNEQDPEPEILDETEGPDGGRNLTGNQRKYRDYRGPMEYGEILKSLGLKLSDHEIAMRYYRERAVPHLVRFPVRVMPESAEPLPEGLETWDFGQALEDVDWLQSVLQSPQVVPGLTTLQRTYGTSSGTLPETAPIDLYLGIDCSGSMPNPQNYISYPALAGVIMALSALRVGARVMAVLSGEPGQSLSTDGFVSQERAVLEVLTGYLGMGYSFGIHRLNATFAARKPTDRAAHILIVSDHDIFSMLDQQQDGGGGWEIARAAVEKAGGGTYVLNMPQEWEQEKVGRMRQEGWRVHTVQNWEDLVAFARAFSQTNYEVKRPGASRR